MKRNKFEKNQQKIMITGTIKLILLVCWVASFFTIGWKMNVICLFLITQIYIGEIQNAKNIYLDKSLVEELDEITQTKD